MSMLLDEFWTWLEMQPLAAHIGETAWFPFLESVHVLSAMFVVGTVLSRYTAASCARSRKELISFS